MCTYEMYILKDERFPMFILLIYYPYLSAKSILFEAVCYNCGNGLVQYLLYYRNITPLFSSRF